MSSEINSIVLFLEAGLCEIGGGSLVWRWWRNEKPASIEAVGIIWGWGVDGIAPDRVDILGGLICLAGVAVIMYWPP